MRFAFLVKEMSVFLGGCITVYRATVTEQIMKKHCKSHDLSVFQ